jgi:hypothetical protein
MRWIALAVLALGFAAPVMAQSPQLRSGHVTRQGTYVPPSYTTRPDSSRSNNYSTRGNSNPFTGQRGYRSPTPSYGGGSRRR